MNNKAIVVGAGIVGLATARALSLNGFEVRVVERSPASSGASVRNFGMIWPIGQPSGKMYERAIQSRRVWKEIGDAAGICYDECGSLHLAYQEDEWRVLQELNDAFGRDKRPVKLLKPSEITSTVQSVKPENLLGGLFSTTEMIIDPRQAIALLPKYLAENHGVSFCWNKTAVGVQPHKVYFPAGSMEADLICICSGADFETLFPSIFAGLQITKCKLQMMRFMNAQPGFRIGTALCGGLSLIHYESFKAAPSLPLLKERYKNELPEYLRAGIHVMVSQNASGELTVGDSHEYGPGFSPFDDAKINDLIVAYLKTFAHIDDWQLIQSWHGIYPKMTNGDTDIFLEADKGVYVVNGLGGAGMTLSFGFAEEVIASMGVTA